MNFPRQGGPGSKSFSLVAFDVGLCSGSYRGDHIDLSLLTAVDSLTGMWGIGLVRDLREAASLQTPAGALLGERLTAYSAAATKAAQQALLPGLVAAWAANDAVWNIGETRFWRNGNQIIHSKSVSRICA